MSDDDDFGLDEGVFDAAVLAELDEIEHKFAAASQQSRVFSSQITSMPPSNSVPKLPIKPSQDRFIRPLPPAKRPRPNEWNATSLPNREYSVLEEDDDTPTYAVVAAKDGKYRIVDSADPPPRTTSLAVLSIPVPPTGSQYVRPMASRRQDASSSSSYPRAGRGMGTQRSTVLSTAPRNVGSSQSRTAAITAALRETRLDEGEEEMEALRAQVAEVRIYCLLRTILLTRRQLRKANEAATAALRAAHEEKLTKEGEISTIRRTIASVSNRDYPAIFLRRTDDLSS
jgi:hypothetical protein